MTKKSSRGTDSKTCVRSHLSATNLTARAVYLQLLLPTMPKFNRPHLPGLVAQCQVADNAMLSASDLKNSSVSFAPRGQGRSCSGVRTRLTPVMFEMVGPAEESTIADGSDRSGLRDMAAYC